MRIAVVNDSVMAVEALRRVLAKAQDLDLAWVARNGNEAVEKCAKDIPDMVLMDLEMPSMDGTQATRQIMSESPCAILIVTSTVETRSAKVFETLGAGALDVVKTPVLNSPENPASGGEALLAKIRLLSGIVHFSKKKPSINVPRVDLRGVDKLVAIGASAGGPGALATLLKALPADFPAPIVIIQHVDEQFAAPMAKWLDNQCDLTVRTAEESEQLTAGTVLMAETDGHLVLRNAYTMGYSAEPADVMYRPSIDVFFQSVARYRRGNDIGILLTGMGRDGALGLKELRDKGAYTIAQDRDTSVVYGMPKQAALLNAATEILPLDKIATRLISLCSTK